MIYLYSNQSIILFHFENCALYLLGFWWHCEPQRYPYLTPPLPCLILPLTSYCSAKLNIHYDSPKFARKLHYFPTLDHLNVIIPVAQLHPPQPALDYDFQLPPIPIPASLLAKYDDGVSQAGQRIFGRSLVELMKEENEQGQKEGVPWVIKALVEHLRLTGKVINRLGSNLLSCSDSSCSFDTVTTVENFRAPQVLIKRVCSANLLLASSCG